MNGTSNSCPAPESGQGHRGVYIIPPVSRSSREEPEPIRIILGETASKALLEAGECFLIVGKGSYPDSPGRMVIHCVPVPKDQADAACAVALGTHRAVKRKFDTSAKV